MLALLRNACQLDMLDQVHKYAMTYKQLLEAGVARELARGVLPLCTYTEFIFTCNLHSLMHFMWARLDTNAQYEIRCYAQGFLELATPHFPASLDAWKIKINLEKQEEISFCCFAAQEKGEL